VIRDERRGDKGRVQKMISEADWYVYPTISTRYNSIDVAVSKLHS
jgi:hypothetical protein